MPRKPGAPLRYREIADGLRRRIEEGEFPPGARLPTERALVNEYTASPGTVRAALGALRDEGLVESRVGSGWYVRSWRPIVRNALKRLSADQWGEGNSIWGVDIDDRELVADGVQIEHLPAGPEIVQVLGLSESDLVWRRSRRYLVDGVPVLRSASYIPDDLAHGTRITQVDTGPGGVYARLAEAGFKPMRFREDLRCRMPSASEMDDLQLAGSTPVVELVRYAYDATGRVVEVNRMILDASRYLLRYDFPS
ncbi:GntR family transcriptional regulator [Streptomyces sp. NPDC126503]|uniref:GntR family transcriptional regulator n=1 Tax=Streptomyces sp. NPDC126503 TaxID=3155315 RepID=UPI00332B4146